MAGARKVVSDRWAARPVLGAALRLLALLGPIAIGFGVALVLAAVLPEPGSALAAAGWWAAVLGGSAVAVFGADRVARRLLPLAILLELSLIFPDKAPSRLRAARTASVRDIDQRLARLRGNGARMEPYDAAETVVTMVGILGLHDKRTRGHSERVRAFTDMLTGELGLDDDARMRLRWAALVHDLGKLTVPADVLNKPGKLDEEAWELMHRHPDEGVRLLAGLLPWLGEWGDAVGQHHERYDGTGYPNGLAGDDIAYAARIVALADSFEVMTSGRSYKTSRSAAWAREEITRCAGSQFDPALVRAFLGISIGRLRWVLGPVTWVAEVPFVLTADRAGQTAKVASVTALAAGLLFVGGMPQGGTPLPAPGGTSVAQAAEQEPASDADRTWDVATGELWTNGLFGRHDGEQLLGAAPAPVGSDRLRSAPGGSTGLTAQEQPGAAGEPGPRPVQTQRDQPLPPPEPEQQAAAPPAPDRAPAPEPQQKPAPAPAADPGPALAPIYYLSVNGLQTQPVTRQETLDLPTGASRVFDRRLDRPVVLPAERTLELFVRFPTRMGSAKVDVQLQDCPPRDACRVLSQGLVTQEKTSTVEYQRHLIRLVRNGTAVERLPAGHVLRVEVTFLEPGAKAPGRMAFGTSATPSRLRFAPER